FPGAPLLGRLRRVAPGAGPRGGRGDEGPLSLPVRRLPACAPERSRGGQAAGGAERPRRRGASGRRAPDPARRDGLL
ncbi:MAG: hypothetical protein AVDCRST_MAG79-2540, partial [uncultured Thermoleophilia bacterium]